MERVELETWFSQHPETIHTDPHGLLDLCERRIRGHAHRDAWVHAQEVAERSLDRFEHIFGLPASETFVTHEVCHEIARQLKRHEPHPGEDEARQWAGQSVYEALDPHGRSILRDWLVALAHREEHAAWLDIIYFTDHLASTLIREGHMTSTLEWDFDHSYPRVAARVARMLLREFEAHATEEFDGRVRLLRRH